MKESLQEVEILNHLNVFGIEETDDQNVEDRWHIYSVFVSLEEIMQLEKSIKDSWYAHFWNETELIVIFRDKTFTCDRNNKETWQQAVEYGLSRGVIKEQLNFLMD